MIARRTLIVGIGSPHGSDQIGWLMVQKLAAWIESHPEVASAIETRLAGSPIDLLNWLDAVDRLILCDACHGSESVGTVQSWSWPTEVLPMRKHDGSHDISLPNVLTLAESLGVLPVEVAIYGVFVDAMRPHRDVSDDALPVEMASALEEVVLRITEDLRKPAQRESLRCTSSRSSVR